MIGHRQGMLAQVLLDEGHGMVCEALAVQPDVQLAIAHDGVLVAVDVRALEFGEAEQLVELQ